LEDAVAILLEMVWDDTIENSSRTRAIELLSKIGNEAILPQLEELAKDPKVALQIRKAAKYAIMRIRRHVG